MADTVFFDIETTGLSRADDRIIELYMTRVAPDGTPIGPELHYMLDPERPVGDSFKIHGVSDEELRGKLKFADVADEVLEYIKGCDLSGYNIVNFDLQFLFEEFYRAGKVFRYMDHRIVDSYALWTKMESRTLTGAVKRFLGESAEGAHGAKVDTAYQVRVLAAQLAEYGMTVDEAARLTENERLVDLSGKFVKGDGGVPLYNFGKYKGRSVFDVYKNDPGYLKWMANESSMPSDAKIFARKFDNMAKSGAVV